MKILVTGAFGNIGEFLIEELLKRRHDVRCFVLPGKKTAAKKFKGIEVFYGDIRKVKDLKNAISGCDAVIHLAFTSPDVCQNNTNFAYKVNIDGTKNLTEVIKDNPAVKLIFPSSISAYFYELYYKSKRIKSLRYKKYAEQKLECENIIKSSLSNWCILRIGAILPTKFPVLKNVLSVPHDVKFRFIDMRDVVTALSNATENKSIGKTFLIGGGKGLCIKYQKFANDIFSLSGSKLPKNNDFSLQPYLTECFSTKAGQKILKYQKHSYSDFLSEMRKQIGKN